MAALEVRPPADGEPAVLDLDRFVPALLVFIANRMTSSGSALFRRRLGIGALDVRVLVMLAIEPGISGARIAEVIGLDKAAVSRTLKSLSQRGFVTTTAARDHARRQQATLTVKGQRLHAQALALTLERERRLLADFSPEERAQLLELLRRMLRQMPRVAALLEESAPTAPRKNRR